MSPSTTATRLTSRMKHYVFLTSAIGRDTFSLFRSFAGEVGPLVRRQQPKNRTVADAFRHTLVTQARQSNQVANSILSMQQQIGLIRYHGVLGYWRHRQGLLQGSTFSSDQSSSSRDDGNANVAQIAFMITSNMRKELSENLGYTAEQIKSLTPVEASLILHHKVKPERKDAELPSLVEAYEAEQARLQEQQEKERQEKERQEKERQEKERQEKERQEKERQEALLATKKEETAPDASAAKLPETGGVPASSSSEVQAPISQQKQPNEGIQRDLAKLYALDTPSTSGAHVAAFSTSTGTEDSNNKSEPPAAEAAFSTSTGTDDSNSKSEPPAAKENLAQKIGAAQSTKVGELDGQKEMPLGSFVATMEEQADTKKVWYELFETRKEENDEQVPVGLFSNLEEAEMALELRETFAARRAKEDPDNLNDEPVTTYEIRQTVK